MTRRSVTRRQFLQMGALATGSLVLAACPAAPAEAPAAADTGTGADDEVMAEALNLTLLSLKGTGWPEFNNLIVDTFMEQTGHDGTLQEAQWPIPRNADSRNRRRHAARCRPRHGQDVGRPLYRGGLPDSE